MERNESGFGVCNQFVADAQYYYYMGYMDADDGSCDMVQGMERECRFCGCEMDINEDTCDVCNEYQPRRG